MWQILANEMNAAGVAITPQQAENKWKSLERAYKAKILHNKKSGREKRKCPYENELEEILAKRHSIVPPCTLATTKNLAVAAEPEPVATS